MEQKNKRGGIVTSTVMGVGGLIIAVIVILVVTQTLIGANLLTSTSQEYGSVQNMSSNFTSGINNISSKIPTILLVVAVVFLFGALVLLIRNTNIMGGIGGKSSL